MTQIPRFSYGNGIHLSRTYCNHLETHDHTNISSTSLGDHFLKLSLDLLPSCTHEGLSVWPMASSRTDNPSLMFPVLIFPSSESATTCPVLEFQGQPISHLPKSFQNSINKVFVSSCSALAQAHPVQVIHFYKHIVTKFMQVWMHSLFIVFISFIIDSSWRLTALSYQLHKTHISTYIHIKHPRTCQS